MMLLFAVAGFVLIILVAFLRGVKDKYPDVCFATALVCLLVMLPQLAVVTQWLRPVTLDGPLHALDVWLRLDSFRLSRFLIQAGWQMTVSLPVYESLPLVIAAAWAFERPRYLMRAVIIGPLLAFPFYLLIPACGPAYAFADWPNSANQLAATILGPRNCMPSMHFAWALLLLLNARNPIWKTFLFFYVTLMAVAVAAGGEHYVVDVIAAIPFAFAVQWIAVRSLRPVAVRSDADVVYIARFLS
jgi:PAP2 superfamily